MWTVKRRLLSALRLYIGPALFLAVHQLGDAGGDCVHKTRQRLGADPVCPQRVLAGGEYHPAHGQRLHAGDLAAGSGIGLHRRAVGHDLYLVVAAVRGRGRLQQIFDIAQSQRPFWEFVYVDEYL